MDEIHFIIISALAVFGSEACEDGWVSYKNQLCIKIFNNIENYDLATTFCNRQGDDASLIKVKELDFQNFLIDQSTNWYGTFWLGGTFDLKTSAFKWNDGDSFTYTNWEAGHPTSHSDTNACMQFSPQHSQGKWTDIECNKPNQIICQKSYRRTLEDVMEQLMKLESDLEETRQECQKTANDLESTKQELEEMKKSLENKTTDFETAKRDIETLKGEVTKSRNDLQKTQNDLQAVGRNIVPVRSIYIEYTAQLSPRTLWPSFHWQDITSTYAGLFFRASGGGAAGWGSTQAECAPRINKMEYEQNNEKGYPNPVNIPANGWSIYAKIGGHRHITGEYRHEALRFYTQGCEVRPKNQAIRIWKRTV